MPLTPKQIAESEAQRFLDENFAQLDLSGCPTALPPPAEDELPDERFAPLDSRGIGLGSAALKKEIERMVYDRDVQEEIARETNNPELLAGLQLERAALVASEFCEANPSYFRSEENFERIVDYLAQKFLGWLDADVEEAQDELIRRGHFTLPNLTAAFKLLSRDGELESDPEQPRVLTEHQRRSIALLASNGDIEGAITKYLQARLPEEVAARITDMFLVDDVYEELADPRWTKIIEEAAWFCWQYGRPNYAPTKERKRFMHGYIAGRIVTAALLDQAWAACQAAEKDSWRDGLLRQTEPREREASQPNLDTLSDEEINGLYRRSMQYAVNKRTAS